VAEGRGKAQADALRRTRSDTLAKLLADQQAKLYSKKPAQLLEKGDLVLVEPGDIIPSDGEVIEGVASVDESAITGESAPVIRESGGDRSAVTGGTRVLSDYIVVRITATRGSTFLDRMIALVEGAERQKTPNEIALNILLAGLTIIFVFAVVTIPAFAAYAGGSLSVLVLVALFVTLIPTTIGALLSAIGIAGMDRLVRFNVLAMSGRAVEAAGDVDTLLLDKTGTIRPPLSCRWKASANRSWRKRRWRPRWRMRRRKAAPSLLWRKANMASAPRRKAALCLSPPRRGCRESMG
jgi:K+-transporting ATPase ATPase B chain